ncbi:MAG: hypothetical protein MRJ68_16920 [Nitrospira sp.]|nr:hypothetical protein [Nitrospira sp.]
MEVIGAILLEALVAIWQVLGEVFLQTVGEIIVEIVGHGMRETFRRPKPLTPWLAVIGYFAWGAILGTLSLWLFQDHFIQSQWLRIANLFLTPVIAGLIMAKVGAWRRNRNQEPIRLDSFAYGFSFAFGMALVRYIWAR